jgi:serine/threonine protein phosphatase PrpC
MQAPALLEVGVASRALHEGACGDRHVLQPFAGGALLGVLDGLGHGAEAAEAARRAVAVLERHAQESVIGLTRRCHHELGGTRGAVMSLASFDYQDHSMTWIGVGNVEGVLLHADPAALPQRDILLLRGGLLGYQLPTLYAAVLPLSRGDLLVLATDGIRHDFADQLTGGQAPQQLAERILHQYARGTDDALVLVARYLGGAA